MEREEWHHVRTVISLVILGLALTAEAQVTAKQGTPTRPKANVFESPMILDLPTEFLAKASRSADPGDVVYAVPDVGKYEV